MCTGSASRFPGTGCLERPAPKPPHRVAVGLTCRRSGSLLRLRARGEGRAGEQSGPQGQRSKNETRLKLRCERKGLFVYRRGYASVVSHMLGDPGCPRCEHWGAQKGKLLVRWLLATLQIERERRWVTGELLQPRFRGGLVNTPSPSWDTRECLLPQPVSFVGANTGRTDLGSP